MENIKPLSLFERIDKILEAEIEISTARSSGPGGQNVNKTNSAIQIKFDIQNSKQLRASEKALLIQKLSSKLTKSFELIIRAEESRDQLQNKTMAKEKLRILLIESLKIPKKRIKTKPKRSAVEKRLVSKGKRSEIKKMRREKY